MASSPVALASASPIANTQELKRTTASSNVTSASSNDGSSQTSLSSLGSTFLQLLAKELQNQDPTAPMDSTQMVGQLISLNELDQTASINQLLSSKLGSN